ncbi:MAG: VWA domain-containing protein [Alphaproteobacteria bacterium]|nr:VWA domain-containing protein [Alphaproteobacteria bacterium]
MTGHLADNVARFAGALRAAGVPVGTGEVLLGLNALEAVGLTSRERVFWALEAAFVKRREHRALFARAFDLYWRDPKLLERNLSLLLPRVEVPREKEPKRAAGDRRLNEAFAAGTARPAKPREAKIEIDASGTASREEQFRTRDFEQMSAAEMRAAIAAVARLSVFAAPEPTRRLGPAPHGRRPDLRRTLRRALAQGGTPLQLLRRARIERPPPIVVLCDISGSMSVYSRVILHFLHALAQARARRGQRVTSFVFGTRLTPITREIARRDVDDALAGIGASVTDWGGGTRLGEALHAFNQDWARRVLTQRALLLLVTDGLERDDPELLAREAARLRRQARRIVWLNPLLRYERFEARAAGIKALLPFVDEFRPAHNLESLESLAAALASPHSREAERKQPR